VSTFKFQQSRLSELKKSLSSTFLLFLLPTTWFHSTRPYCLNLISDELLTSLGSRRRALQAPKSPSSSSFISTPVHLRRPLPLSAASQAPRRYVQTSLNTSLDPRTVPNVTYHPRNPAVASSPCPLATALLTALPFASPFLATTPVSLTGGTSTSSTTALATTVVRCRFHLSFTLSFFLSRSSLAHIPLLFLRRRDLLLLQDESEDAGGDEGDEDQQERKRGKVRVSFLVCAFSTFTLTCLLLPDQSLLRLRQPS
jgi:hypothetical protein